MKAILQRVTSASVTVEGKLISKISGGLVVLLGIGEEDDDSKIPLLAKKICELRIFSDTEGKMNLSLQDLDLELLLISQFTLYANCSRGRRPDFTHAAQPSIAKDLYIQMTEHLKSTGIKVRTGIFGADMKLALVGDGPVSIVLEI
ncbi:MAG: D-aminoacyl-tRNA deacylase [Candidatus Cloacimonetes bacterium]|nr:D-aminoacyl-tRNA deacylase [Candidatus Cloacimonadota bacterium]